MHIKDLVIKLMHIIKNEKWSILIYEIDDINQIFDLDDREPKLIISEFGFRKSYSYKSTMADPFLFQYGNYLYIFYEIQNDFEHGEIWVSAIDKSGNIINFKKVLKEDYHLSYPNVFKYENKIYMMPEMGRSGSTYLFEAIDFPKKWKKVKRLIDGRLFDPNIIFVDDGVFVFGTVNSILKMYYSESLYSEFREVLEITSDKKTNRNAGPIISINGSMYRFAQNCHNFYGEDISVHKILNINKSNYVEIKYTDPLIKKPHILIENGYHHISTASFNGAIYVAVDGRRKDSSVNNLMLLLYKVISKVAGIFKNKSSAI